VLTGRCENYLHGRRDLADTIARLQAYQQAGADVVYAPGLTDPEEIRQVVASVDVPVNVLCLPGGPDVAGLAGLGVARISVGSAFYNVALGALVAAAHEWKESGTHQFWQGALAGMQASKQVFD
jgi:2-methylisocitrate lyase-like PEP mutase family enzyme